MSMKKIKLGMSLSFSGPTNTVSLMNLPQETDGRRFYFGAKYNHGEGTHVVSEKEHMELWTVMKLTMEAITKNAKQRA